MHISGALKPLPSNDESWGGVLRTLMSATTSVGGATMFAGGNSSSIHLWATLNMEVYFRHALESLN
jgi:hypothetical protein